MDNVYSVALLVSLVSGIVALVFACLPWLQNNRMERKVIIQRAVIYAVTVAAVSIAISVTVHWIFGHGSGTAEPLRMLDFARIHPAVIVAGLLPPVSIILLKFSPAK